MLSQMHHLGLQLYCQFNTFQHGIQFCQVYVLLVIYWSKQACIFQYSSMVLQNYTYHQEPALTQEFISFPATHQSPWAGSFCHTLVSISTIICLREASFTVSFHPFVTMLAHLFIIPVTAQSHPQTGKCPTNFPQMENTMCHVIVMGIFGIEFPCFHHTSCIPDGIV